MESGRKERAWTAAPILPKDPETVPDGAAYLRSCCEQEMQAENCILKDITVRGEDFYKLDCRSVIMENCTFLDCGMEKASFVDVLFHSCDFSNSHIPDGYFNRCAFRSVKGVGTDFHEGLFREVCMEDCVFSFANFSGSKWETVLLRNGDLHESYLEECRLRKVRLQGMKLNRASLFHTSLKGMDLRDNEIEGLVLSEEKKELSGAVTDLYQAAELARLLGIIIK